MIRNQLDSSANAFLVDGGRGGFSGPEDFPGPEDRAADLRRISALLRTFASALNRLADALCREKPADPGIRTAGRASR
jgi:hypothetical protein